MSDLSIKRKKDGKTFSFEFVSFGRGEWAVNLVAVDGETVSNGMGDPVHPTERAARAAARAMVELMERTPRYGWCVVEQGSN
jgi:hypothetical protein